MDKSIEIELSSSEDELKPTEEIIKEYKIRKLVDKPKKRILTKAQLETSRRNLEKAREARLNKAKNKPVPKRNDNIIDEYESDSDSNSSSDSDVPIQVTRVSKQQQEEDKPIKHKKKLLDKIDKLESMISKMGNKKKNVHKTIIMQQPYQPQHGGNDRSDNIKKQLMLDLF